VYNNGSRYSLWRGESVFFRSSRIPNILICFFAYFPVLFGNGECVAVCISQNGSVSIIYQYQCKKQTAAVSNTLSVLQNTQNNPCSDYLITSCTDASEITPKSSENKLISLAHVPSVSISQTYLTQLHIQDHNPIHLRTPMPHFPLSSILII
jgi:hypothetical protein